MKHLSTLVLCFIIFCVFGSIAYSQEIQMGTFTYGATNEGYALHKGNGDRMSTLEITFTKPFEVKPDVVINVNTLDAEKSTNIRFTLKAVSVSRDGFTIQVKTWADTQINLIGGTWIAVAQKK